MFQLHILIVVHVYFSIISLQTDDIKYSHHMQIIRTQLNVFNYFCLILTIHPKSYKLNSDTTCG